MKKAVVIGAGFGGLSCACYLAKAGFDVTILEKNDWVGGRAQVWESKGFRFDMGPSWYWMPEVFDNFFADFGKRRVDYYEIKRLDPSYRIFFEDEMVDLPAGREAMIKLVEKYEKGAGKKLDELLTKTEKVYEVAMNTFIYRTYDWKNIWDIRFVTAGIKLLAQYNGLRSTDSLLRSYFKNEKIIKMLTFPVFFLGESSKNIPSVYALMNHVDINLGTWYPMGGFSKVAESVATLAKELGVKIEINSEIGDLEVKRGKSELAEVVVSNADYRSIEMMLPPNFRSYSENYWQTRKLAPSAFLVYLGLNKKLKNITHHSLFFHNDWEGHNRALFEEKKWPENPLYYVSCPTKTEPELAAKGGEALIILIPVAAGIEDNEKIRKKYFDWVVADLEKKLEEKVEKLIVTKRIYAIRDFEQDYNAFKGNGYGLGQTALQTAIFRPSHRSKKVKNLFYTGQFTVPGTGVPMVIISGKVVADEIRRSF